MKNLWFLFWAYTAIFGVLGWYLLRLGRKLVKLERRVKDEKE